MMNAMVSLFGCGNSDTAWKNKWSHLKNTTYGFVTVTVQS